MLAVQPLGSECSTSMLVFSHLFQLLPVLRWGYHISNHAISFLSQRFSTTNISWWLGYLNARWVSHPPSTPTVPSVIAKYQGPASLCPCWCGHCPWQCCGHPHSPLAEHLALAAPLQTQVIWQWEPCVHFIFTLAFLCAKISAGFSKCGSHYSIIKCFAHSTPTGEEGPISPRWQACMGDNVIHSH